MDKLYRNRKWLYQKYWEEELSTMQIARLCDCRRCTIRFWMKKFEIKLRSGKDARRLRLKSRPIDYSYQNKKWLYRKYWKEGLGFYRIARLCGADKKTVRYWFHKFGIRPRNKNEISKLNRKLMLRRLYGSRWKRISLVIRGSIACFKKYVLP